MSLNTAVKTGDSYDRKILSMLTFLELACSPVTLDKINLVSYTFCSQTVMDFFMTDIVSVFVIVS